MFFPRICLILIVTAGAYSALFVNGAEPTPRDPFAAQTVPGAVATPFVPYASERSGTAAMTVGASTMAAGTSAAVASPSKVAATAVVESPTPKTRIIDDTKLVPIHLPIHDTYMRPRAESTPAASRTSVSAVSPDSTAKKTEKKSTSTKPSAAKTEKSQTTNRPAAKPASPEQPADKRASGGANLPQPPIPLK